MIAGARGGTRTRTPVKASGPKPGASTNFATRAGSLEGKPGRRATPGKEIVARNCSIVHFSGSYDAGHRSDRSVQEPQGVRRDSAMTRRTVVGCVKRATAYNPRRLRHSGAHLRVSTAIHRGRGP